MGLLDYNTSDGRFLFMLPWEKHTLIGTTDTKGPAETLPNPPEDEVEWLLHECKKYLSPDLKVRRSDVLSAWRGWRPLAVDPHAPPGAPASRDHVISENPETDVMFIAGGKWTTWREMAQEVVDRIVGGNGPKCKTLKIKLFGGDDFHRNIPIELIQKYQMEQDVAEHLARAYGARAWEVCEHARPTGKTWPKFGTPLANGYPYIDAEVVWACREYACTIEDILSRRTRLAFLNKDAAFEAIPQVADIMANELGWTEYVKEQQIAAAQKYVESYKGSKSERVQERLKSSTYRSVHEIFNALDTHQNGFLERDEVQEVAEILGFTLSKQEIAKVFAQMDKLGKGRVDAETFEKWWYEASESPFHKQLSKELSLYISTEKELKEMGGGTFFG
jgi:glycerol-3-phosphate dehydrogenase